MPRRRRPCSPGRRDMLFRRGPWGLSLWSLVVITRNVVTRDLLLPFFAFNVAPGFSPAAASSPFQCTRQRRAPLSLQVGRLRPRSAPPSSDSVTPTMSINPFVDFVS